jgi:H+-transporting ATPase
MVATAVPFDARPRPAKSAVAAKDELQNDLPSDEASRRLEKFGPNAMPDTALHPLRMGWRNSGRLFRGCSRPRSCSNWYSAYVEAGIIAGLPVFNAALGLFQESRAQATLAALKSRLALNASVRRDGAWKTVPAAELVPGDVVKLSLGAVVAADVHLTGGEVLLDQSMLTSESVPIEAGAGVQTYAGHRRYRMAPLPAWIVACTLAAATAFAVVADLVKVPAFRRLGIA